MATNVAAPGSGTSPVGAETAASPPDGTPVGTRDAAGGATPSTDAAPSGTDELTVTGGILGGTYSLIDFRIGRHDGFTRLVWEMAETEGSPRYEVVQRLADGDHSGTANDGVPVPSAESGARSTGESGQAGPRLVVILSDVYAYGMTGALSVDAPDEGAVLGSRLLPLESDSLLQFVVDLSRPVSAIAVRTLEDPVRVIVDVPDE